MTGFVRARLRGVAPDLSNRLDALVGGWTEPLARRLDQGTRSQSRPKQVNDPIWGTIELLPWEVALLDTDLLQRMRGVRQLGLAQLVFPSACHDRLEHILGVIGAVEVTLATLSRQIERRNRDQPDNPLPVIRDEDRYCLRLAALFHDLGHGPFSHATEPVMELDAVLRPIDPQDEAPDWRQDLSALAAELLAIYQYNSEPAISEIIAVMILLSEPITAILNRREFGLPATLPIGALQDRLTAAITGAVEGPGADHLTAVVSGQLDADKLDYLQRDAHHAGLEIGFDTDRLLSRLEILQVREENIDGSLKELRARVKLAPHETLLQLGIAASGFGSFEQMLIGRTFLYDRLYHHHKVRAAEAMAQRLILIAERDRTERFSLEDLFVNLGDDTVLRLFAGHIRHDRFPPPSPSAAALANGILSRELLHRAFALRGRFIGVAPDLDQERQENRRRTLWLKVVADLKTLRARYEIGERIHALAITCAEALIAHGIEVVDMQAMRAKLVACGPEQIIVDLSSLKADAIKILARYPNGSLRVPEFSFNPVKWSNAYELQKRTSYVFCPRDVVPLIALAAKLEFFARYGIVLAQEADGFIKADRVVNDAWIDALRQAGVVDTRAFEHLTTKRISLISVQEKDLAVPQPWLDVNEDFGIVLAQKLNAALRGGIAAEQLAELTNALTALWRMIDEWYRSGKVSETIADEAELQRWVGAFFSAAGIRVTEAPKAGGGITDLILNDTIVLENKHSGAAAEPVHAKGSAGMQGRRYAIALDKQIVLVVHAYKSKSILPDKQDTASVHQITDGDRRVELRVDLPYGAPIPSRETEDKTARRPNTQ
ncbi:HD domain-containing protein [Sphingosinithalassobacter sp. CS137]|uniref:HD domain-containing protein n=1 Tax=Sphingosinithalassobacter sp. CS137 TaxID=2762748 RepID=UPI00165E6F64|nr:HD domain-containing protein [Sphingosinithalassobacter sp. CS137]